MSALAVGRFGTLGYLKFKYCIISNIRIRGKYKCCFWCLVPFMKFYGLTCKY